MKWFMHDSNASMNAKLKRLILKYGAEGYGVYWFCLELIAQQVDVNNLTFELEHDAEIIGHSINLSDKKVADIMHFMVELELFENSRGVITCLKLANRVDEYTKKLLKNPDNVPTISGECPTKSALLDKNRLDNNIIEYKKTKFIKPTQEELKSYFIALSSSTYEAEKFNDFYESKHWMVGKNKMKDWRASARLWVRRNKDNLGAQNGIHTQAKKPIRISASEAIAQQS